METRDLLFELQTEELPPKSLINLRNKLVEAVGSELKKLNFEFSGIKGYATPRRLAFIVEALAEQQADQAIERKGPSLDSAFDAHGNPTKALLGFCRSCGVDDPDTLDRDETEKGTWLVFRSVLAGQNIRDIINDVLEKALGSLPIERRMRWGSSRAEFVRPVHYLIVMYGEEIVPCNLLGLVSNNKTMGHRFMSHGELSVGCANDYIEVLRAGFVIADFDERKALILSQLNQISGQEKADIVIDPALLDEVTSLVEWPVALMGQFDPDFLSVPEEALISAMKSHQRYFHMLDKHNKLLPRFITIANIESSNPDAVIKGNERVISPRLTDAGFFFSQDQKITLEQHLARLEKVVFQAELGTYKAKAERISDLASFIASLVVSSTADAGRAGLLCKADLVTDMVSEFPELQGLMGGYYAQAAGEADAVALAIAEHYLPGFSGDKLPSNDIGQIVAIADKLDTLVGLFGIKQPPTGSRDPFALRRQTLGVVRICIENQLDLDILAVLQKSSDLYKRSFDIQPVYDYLLDRLGNWYQDQQVPADTFAAVRGGAQSIASLSNCHQRVMSIQNFRQRPEAESLISANKRLSNILKKAEAQAASVDESLFEQDAERILFTALQETSSELLTTANYDDQLLLLARLQPKIDSYFEGVMVMADNPLVRANRLACLTRLQNLFLSVADFSVLQ